MNKYIKKCLMIYSALSLILVGMVGVTYAITATDADQYVTRSQYAVDMAHLQNKLDEQEAGLMGSINRFRSTNVKFVTFDTPSIQPTGNVNYGGYHTGGNMFPRQQSGTSSDWQYSYGIITGGGIANRDSAHTGGISMYRLWNGNYYITDDIAYRSGIGVSNPYSYYPMVRCAVPVENLPGWYLTMGTFQKYSTYIPWAVALVKLDPNVPFPTGTEMSSIIGSDLQVRFKKDLWIYNHPTLTPKVPTTKTTNSMAFNYFTATDLPYISSVWKDNKSATGTRTITFSSWVDPETGDYMMTFRNMIPQHPSYSLYTYWISTSDTAVAMTKLIPKDNVEYLMGPLSWNSYNYEGGTNNTYVMPMPKPDAIGTGNYTDPAFDCEIVDGVNGIKYWHSYKKPSTDKVYNRINNTFGMHYSLPIVY